MSLHWHIYPLITTVNKMQASCLEIPQVSLPPPLSVVRMTSWSERLRQEALHSQHSFGIVITVWRPRVQQCTMGMCPAECSMGRAGVGRRRGGAAQGAVPAHMTHTRQLGPAARTACMSAHTDTACWALYRVIPSYTQLFWGDTKLYTKLYRAALREVTGATVVATTDTDIG